MKNIQKVIQNKLDNHSPLLVSFSFFYGGVSTWLMEQIHVCIVFRPWVRLMSCEDTVEVIWCYFVGFQWMSLALLWF
jgi:hypothetical protein